MNDPIERQDAIDAIRASASKYTGFMEMEMYTDDDAVEAINGVPSAQQWIPCSERLPEDGEKVILQMCGNEYITDFYAIDFFATGLIKRLSAWMPLPEPWEGSDMRKEVEE